MKRVVQVGVGSGGIVALDLVMRDPRISQVSLVDPDVYQPHNVHRHLFPRSDVGRLKVELAAEWIRDRRPDLTLNLWPIDLQSAAQDPTFLAQVAACDIGICAVDQEPAKYLFDQLFRQAGKPWTLGEVLSGGIAGWVHRFWPGGPCYACVASHLQRQAPGSDPAAPPPNYANPDGPIETTIPATRASVDAIAALQALLTLDFLDRDTPLSVDDFTSLLLPMKKVAGIFPDPFRTYRMAISRRSGCLICCPSASPQGDALDSVLNAALARLSDG